MDLSLKQRLLGAAVLIALAVIFVPMFMSGSAPQKSAEMETSSLAIPPAPDREFQTRVLPVDSVSNSPTAAPAAPADDGHIATVDTATAPKPAETLQPAAQTPTPAPAPAAPPSTKPAQPVATTPPPATTTPEPPKPVPGQVADGRYFVHLGVYTASKNADDLVAGLKKDGYPAFAESSSFQGKPASRVRVGPFADRAAAEAARLRIKQVKPSVPGSVVQLASDATADATPAALPKTRAGAFAVQLGALKTAEDANKLRDRVKNAGYAAFVDKVESNGATLWRVRVGPEVDRAAADKLKVGIKDKLKLDGMIVTL
ncbi:SPOR domain-containing protein [Dokdonella sp.]|uniref:SPOR domain-containing protein n=1 Tax=Dokdonella sp. TaxID=2291710 RepID=UPI001B185DE2|nr:SPOR domain-containing protein [Dokdonella sp.]MBO9662347.1 SPOR domain-containing protein [Dokdonella sp.]